MMMEAWRDIAPGACAACDAAYPKYLFTASMREWTWSLS